MSNQKYAVIENNKVINIVVGIEDEVVAANPDKYIAYEFGDLIPSPIDGNGFFPKPVIEEVPENSGPTVIVHPQGE